MLIKIDDYIINLDNVKEICFDGFEISFMYSDTEIRKIGFEDKKEIERVLNEIISNYNSGKKVCVIK